MRLITLRTTVAGVAVLVVACTENSVTAPGALKGAAARRSIAGSHAPTRFSNSVKYRDAGLKPASGRSGSATLTARALLGRDGVATLDVTTGAIDQPGAPGSLAKVQLKQFDPNGLLQNTTNYTKTTGATAQYLLPARVRGSKIQVQANVTGIDPKRTDVVTITESVKLRPDLSVESVGAPAEAVRNTPVNISAVVTERNGDVGARGDCVLSVDGGEIDRAPGIWVDAGGTVSCVFRESFSTLGSKQLAVRMTGVNPGDFDVSNNAASASINIVNPAPPPRTGNDFWWWGYVGGTSNYSGSGHNDGWWRAPWGHSEWSYDQQVRHGDWRYTQIWGSTPGAMSVSIATYNDRIDGTTLNDGAFDPSTDPHWVYDQTWNDWQLGEVQLHQECSWLVRTAPITAENRSGFALVAALSVCSNRWSGNAPAEWNATYFGYYSQAGDVSYYSNYYYNYGDGSYVGTYSFNGDVKYSYGTIATGSEYAFEMLISGPDGTRRAAGTIPLTSSAIHVQQPYQCYDYSDSYWAQHYCFENDYSWTNFYGWNVGAPTQ